MQKTCTFCVSALVGWGSVAMGGVIPIEIPNFSFEGPDATGNTAIISGAPTGWSKGADVGVHNGGVLGAPVAAEGGQIAFLGNGTNFTNLYRDITSPVIGSDTAIISYTLTIALARRTVDGNTNGTINVGLHDINSGNAGLTWTPVARSSLLTTDWQDFSVTLSALTVEPGDSIRVFLDKLNGNSLTITDNWRLVANTIVVPEPSAMGLLGLASTMLVRRRR